MKFPRIIALVLLSLVACSKQKPPEPSASAKTKVRRDAATAAPTLTTIAVDGVFADWQQVMLNPLQVTVDGNGSISGAGCYPTNPDRDCESFTPQRDVSRFAWTFDGTNIYTSLERPNSNATLTYSFVMDVDADGLAETTDRVLQVDWKTGGRAVGVKLFAYVPAVGGGDPMACPNAAACPSALNPRAAVGFVDGYTMPGTTGVQLWSPPAPVPACTGSAVGDECGGDGLGTRFEVFVPWAQLGAAVVSGSPIFWHVASSTNAQFNQAKDNVGGPDGKLGSFGVFGMDFTPDRNGFSTSPGTVEYCHDITNTGNFPDAYNLSGICSVGSAISFFTDTGGCVAGTQMGLDANGDGDFADVGDSVNATFDTDADGRPNTLNIAANTTRSIVIRLNIPTGLNGSTDQLVATARSIARPTLVFDTVTDRTKIGPVTVTPDLARTGTPGVSVDFGPHMIRNNQSFADTFNYFVQSSHGYSIALYSDAAGSPGVFIALDSNGDGVWDVGTPNTGLLASGGSVLNWIRVTVPAGAPIGTVDAVTFTLTSTTVPATTGSAQDTLTILNGLTIGPSYTAPSSQLFGPAGTSVYLPHFIINSLQTTNTVALTQTGTLAAGYTHRWWTDPNGDGNISDGTLIIAPFTLAASGGTANIVTEVTIPSSGVPASTTPVTTVTGPTTTASADDHVAVGSLQTYKDALFTQPSRSFAACNTIYAKALLPLANQTTNYQLVFTDPPLPTAVVRSSNNLPTDSVGEGRGSYTLLPADELGSWRVQIFAGAIQVYDLNPVVVESSGSATVSGPAAATNNQPLAVSALLTNTAVQSDYEGTSVTFVVRDPSNAVLRTSTVTGINVGVGGAANAFGTWPNVSYPAYGNYTVTATWNTSCGSVIATGSKVIPYLAPAPILLTPANNAFINTTTPALTGTAEPGATVNITIDGVLSGTATANAAGAFSYSAPAQSAGAHTWSATQTINTVTGPASVTFTFNVDLTAPAAPVLTAPANGSLLNTTLPTYSGTAEANSTVTVRVDGVVACTTTATAGGAFSCVQAVALGQGAHGANATATDAATNTSVDSNTNTFTIDTLAPAAPVVSAPANGSLVGTTTPTYSGTAEANSTVTVRVDGIVACSTTATAGGAFSCVQAVALGQGAHTVNATATDAATNTSANSNTNTFTVDTVPPAAPVVSAPANGSLVNTPTPTYSGTAEGNSTVTVRVDGVVACTTTALAGGLFSCVQGAALGQGAHAVNATATDAAGNVSAVSNTNNFTVDTVGPAAPVVSAPANGSLVNTTTPTYSGTAEANSTVIVRVNAVVACSTTATGAGTFSCVQGTALAQGAHSVNATATDAASNVSPVSNTNNFTVDSLAPAAPVVSAPANGSLVNTTTPAYSGTAEASSTVTVRVDGVVACSTTATGAGTFSCVQGAALGQGAHAVNATATDAASNVSPVSNTNTFTVDSLAPAAPVVNAPANGSLLSTTVPTYSGTAEAGSTVTVRVDGGVACTTPATGGGTFSCVQGVGLAQGPHAVNATATDAAGNVSAVSNTNNFTVDTVAPVAPVVSAPANGSFVNTVTPSYGGTAEAGSTVTVSVDGAVACSGVASAGGVFSCVQPVSLTQGVHTVNATATDAGGNTSPVSNTNTFTVDTVPPAAPVVTAPAHLSTIGTRTPTYSGTAEAGSTVSVSVDGAAACTAVANGSGAWSCAQPTPLADLTHTVNATAADVATNVSVVSNSNTFTVLIVGPNAPVVVSPANNSFTNNTQPTYSGTSDPNNTITVSVDSAVVCTTTASAAGTWSCAQPTALGVGTHDVNAVATNTVPLTSAPSPTNTFTVDTAAPASPVVLSPADGSTGNNPTLTYSGTAEAGSTVTVTVDAGVACTAVASAIGTWSCAQPVSLGDGSHTVSATARDAANNTSGSSAVNTFAIDTSLPAAPVVIAPADASASNDSTPTYSGTAEAGSTVTVRVDGNVACSAVTTAAGTFSCTQPTALVEGVHLVNATAADPSSNVSPVSNTNSFTIDQTTPAAPVVTSPADNSVSGNNLLTYSGTAEAASTVSVSVDGAVVCTATTSAAGLWSCAQPTALADGAHSVNATAQDPATNTSVASATNAFTIDTGAPAAPVLSLPANASSISDTSPTYSGTAEVGSTVTVSVDGAVACIAVTSAAGTFSCAQPITLADGAHTANAISRDAANNASAVSNTNSFTVDSAAPLAPVVLAPANGSTGNDPTPTYSGTAEANSTVSVTVDGAIACTATTSAAGAWSCDQPTALLDGIHSVSATARDAASNVSVASATNTFTLSTSLPDAPVVTAPAHSSASNNTLPSYSGTAVLGTTVTVRVDGNVACTATTTAGGTFSCTQPTALSEGVHTVNATATDAATNVSPVSNTNTFTVDTTAPAVPVVTAPANNSSGNNPLPAYSGTAEAGSTVTVRVDGAVACTAVASSTGAWNCAQPTALTEGPHTVNATATDPAGNVSGAGPTVTFTLDTTAPNTSIVTGPPAQDPSTTANFDFSSTEAGSTFECSLDAATFTACTDPATFGPLSVGSHTLQVRATDPSGNTDPTPAQQTWNVLPQIDTTIVSGPPALTKVAAAPFDFSSNTANVTYECSVDGASFAACTDPVSFTVPDGPHTLRVRAMVSASDFDLTPATHRWTVDTLPPAAPVISSPTNGSTVAITPVAITGSGEPGATITVVIDGVAAGTAVVDLAGTWTFIPTAVLAEGMHTVTASATDPAGNVGPSSVPVTFTLDPNVLDTAIVAGPSGLTNSKSATFDFSSNKTGVTFECSLDGAVFAACSDPSTLSNLAEGPHTLRVRAKDGTGATDASPASRFWKIDSVAPAAAVVISPANGATVGTPLPVVTGTAEAGSTVTVVLDGVVAGTALVDANGNWSFVPSAALGAGPHTVAARATDPAGNIGPDSPTHTFTVDTTLVDTFIVSGPLALTRFDSAAFDLASNLLNVTYECNLDGAGFVACTDPATYSGLADGSHTLLVRAKDAANNVDPTPASFTWKVDTTAPAAPVVTTPANGATLIDTRPTVTGTAEPGATVLVSIDGQFIGWAIADANGNWSLPTTVALAEGSHTVNAVATDAVGNKGPVSATNTFTVLTTALTPPTITEPADGTVTSDTTPTVKGKAPPNSTVSVFVDGVLAGTTVADANGDWTFTLPMQQDGTRTVTAKAEKGPQTSAASAPKVIVIDTTAPDVQIVKAPPATNLDPTANFEFSSNDPAATYECSLDKGAFAPCTQKYSLQGLALGAHELTVRAVDAAGNRSATKSATWTQAEAVVSPPLQQLVGGGCGCSTVDPTALFALLGLMLFAARRRSAVR